MLSSVYLGLFGRQLVSSVRNFRTFTVCNIFYLLHDVASGSDIMSCNNINKPVVVYRFKDITLDVHFNIV